MALTRLLVCYKDSVFGFFFTGFLTAVLQTAARANSISVDQLSWEFTVLTVDDSNLTGPPKVKASS